MTVSLNQVEQTAKKAVRGAGYAWGIAEESGKAVRWLEKHGLDGLAHLLVLLDRHADREYGEVAPIRLQSPLEAAGEELSPLVVGVTLGDLLGSARAGDIRTGPIASPILLTGFAGLHGAAAGMAVTLNWPGVEIVCGAAILGVDGRQCDLEAARVDALQADWVDGSDESNPAPADAGVEVDAEVWRRLDRYACRTYVEATAASREKGAGAGLADND